MYEVKVKDLLHRISGQYPKLRSRIVDWSTDGHHIRIFVENGRYALFSFNSDTNELLMIDNNLDGGWN